VRSEFIVLGLLIGGLISKSYAADLLITGVLHHQVFNMQSGTLRADNHADFTVASSPEQFWCHAEFRKGSPYKQPRTHSFEIYWATNTCFHLVNTISDSAKPAINKGSIRIYRRLFPGPEVCKSEWLWLAFSSMPILSNLSPSSTNIVDNMYLYKLPPLFYSGEAYETGREPWLETALQLWGAPSVGPKTLVQLSPVLPQNLRTGPRRALPLFHTNLTFHADATTNIGPILVPTAWRVELWGRDMNAALKGTNVPQLMERGIVTNALITTRTFDVAFRADDHVYIITDYRVQPPGPNARPAAYLSSNGPLPKAQAEAIARAATVESRLREERQAAAKRTKIKAAVGLVIILPIVLTATLYLAAKRSKSVLQ